MIDLKEVVFLVLYLIGAAIVFAILWWLVNWIAKEWQAPPFFIKIARTVLVILAALVSLFIVIYLLGGFGSGPMFRWGS